MIILDTNVLSELMRSKPNQFVLQWIGQHKAENLYITALTQAETCLNKTIVNTKIATRYSLLDTGYFRNNSSNTSTNYCTTISVVIFSKIAQDGDDNLLAKRNYQ